MKETFLAAIPASELPEFLDEFSVDVGCAQMTRDIHSNHTCTMGKKTSGRAPAGTGRNPATNKGQDSRQSKQGKRVPDKSSKASRKEDHSQQAGPSSKRQCVTERFAQTIKELGEPEIITSRDKQREALNDKYRWRMECGVPGGILYSAETLGIAMGAIDTNDVTWKLEVRTNYKARDGWVPWLEVKKSVTSNTNYRVFALREFRKDDVIGWVFGKQKETDASDFCVNNIDAEGTTDCFLGMGLHLVADPSQNQDDVEIAKQLKKMWNVKFEADGKVLCKKAISTNSELRGNMNVVSD